MDPMSAPTLEQVNAALATVNDPEIKRPITDLGMVESVEIAEDGMVAVRVLLTVAGCPHKDTINRDVTAAVAPSVEIEQGLFNVVGHAMTRVDEELAAKRPGRRWILHRLIRGLMSERKRTRLATRLTEQTRNRERFAADNTYLMMALEP